MSQSIATDPPGTRPRRFGKPTERMWLLGSLTLGFITLMAGGAIFGFIFSGRREAELVAYGAAVNDSRMVQQALTDAETGVRGYVVARRPDYLEPYFTGLRTLDMRGPAVLTRLDADVNRSGHSVEAHAVSSRISDLRLRWASMLRLVEAQSATPPDITQPQREQKQLMDELRGFIGGYIQRRTAEAVGADTDLALERRLLLGVELFGALTASLALITSFSRSISEIHRREAAMAESAKITTRLEQLFSMTSTLQSLTDREDATQVMRATAIRLLPGFSGMLYLFNNSQDRLDLCATWGDHGREQLVEHIAPSTCWAMKRGKHHCNTWDDGGLRCSHFYEGSHTTLEIPMAARGQVFGLLKIIRPGAQAEAALQEVLPIATAIADAMSLALSSLTLRDMLRNQALRDALTGLYNRRFLDEILVHLSLEAKRRRTTLCAIMIDLDHFKRLNDQHGHATGDAVLREVASVLINSLRASDIACRYGGEELAVLLPDCSLDMAVYKAEQLRSRISEVVPGPGGGAITASFGVAAIPDTSHDPVSLLASADAALYRAKGNGRNCVVQADILTLAASSSTITAHLETEAV